MTMSVKTEPQKSTGPQECAGCGKKIQDRYLLKALDMYWHEDCLKCGCCDCRLGEVGSTLYTKGNLILCKRDYLRLFGTTGYCAACGKVIPAFEMVMRAKTNVYHLECFACQQCTHRFCVGDRFFLCDNKILCEYDYEERMVFANLAYNSSNLAQIKQQARSVGGAGGGGGAGASQGNNNNNNNNNNAGGGPNMNGKDLAPQGPPPLPNGLGQVPGPLPPHSSAPNGLGPSPVVSSSGAGLGPSPAAASSAGAGGPHLNGGHPGAMEPLPVASPPRPLPPMSAAPMVS